MGTKGTREHTQIVGGDSDVTADVTANNELLVAGSNVDGSIDVTIVAGGAGGSGTEYSDGDAIGAGTGGLILGSDGANAQTIITDADGHLQVDILSGGGGGGGTAYADGAARGTATGGLMMGDDGTLIQAVSVDVDGDLQVDVKTLPGTAEADLAAMVVDLAAIEVVLGTIDTDTSAIALDTAALVVDAAASEVLLTTIDADTGNISAAVATEGSALGSGVLLQGDDGTDRTNVAVDTSGNVQVAVVSGGTPAALTETDIYTATITATTDNEIIAAAGASNKLSIHKIILANQGIPCQIKFRFGAGSYWGHIELPSTRSSRTLTFSPAITATDANEAFNAASDTASVDVDITIIAEVVT